MRTRKTHRLLAQAVRGSQTPVAISGPEETSCGPIPRRVSRRFSPLSRPQERLRTSPCDALIQSRAVAVVHPCAFEVPCGCPCSICLDRSVPEKDQTASTFRCLAMCGASVGVTRRSGCSPRLRARLTYRGPDRNLLLPSGKGSDLRPARSRLPIAIAGAMQRNQPQQAALRQGIARQ